MKVTNLLSQKSGILGVFQFPLELYDIWSLSDVNIGSISNSYLFRIYHAPISLICEKNE